MYVQRIYVKKAEVFFNSHTLHFQFSLNRGLKAAPCQFSVNKKNQIYFFRNVSYSIENALNYIFVSGAIVLTSTFNCNYRILRKTISVHP